MTAEEPCPTRGIVSCVRCWAEASWPSASMPDEQSARRWKSQHERNVGCGPVDVEVMGRG